MLLFSARGSSPQVTVSGIHSKRSIPSFSSILGEPDAAIEDGTLVTPQDRFECQLMNPANRLKRSL